MLGHESLEALVIKKNFEGEEAKTPYKVGYWK